VATGSTAYLNSKTHHVVHQLKAERITPMWIFTRDGFYSAVHKDCKEDEVLVRSRQKADLLALGKKIGLKLKIARTALSDYRYRTVVKKDDWAKYLSEAALELDYNNFKNKVPRTEFKRHSACLRCWEALCEESSLSRVRVKDKRLSLWMK
jgi:hypothetical protein